MRSSSSLALISLLGLVIQVNGWYSLDLNITAKTDRDASDHVYFLYFSHNSSDLSNSGKGALIMLYPGLFNGSKGYETNWPIGPLSSAEETILVVEMRPGEGYRRESEKAGESITDLQTVGDNKLIETPWLDVQATLRCAKMFYGPKCARGCAEFAGHHRCDENGHWVCTNGSDEPECGPGGYPTMQEAVEETEEEYRKKWENRPSRERQQAPVA